MCILRLLSWGSRFSRKLHSEEAIMDKELPLILVFVTVLITGYGVSCGSVADANTFIDAVVKDYLSQSLKSFDPTMLPGFNTSFRTSHDVVANFSRGALTGLTGVKRRNNCTAPNFSSNPDRNEINSTGTGNATLTCSLTFDKLHLKYDLNGKYGVFSVSNAVAEGSITSSDVFIEVTTSAGKNLPALKEFSVRYLGNFESDFSRLRMLSWPKDTLGKVFQDKSSLLVVDILNGPFRQEVADSVNKLTMPMP